MIAFAQWVALSSGWPRRAVAVLSGAVGALAMAPVDALPALFVAMTMAVWLIDGAAEAERNWRLPFRSMRAAAALGWWWGFGYFVAGFWWLGAAFLVEPRQDIWALPFGVFGVPALLAVFPALGFGLASTLWSAGSARILALAAGLTFSEWLRGWVLTGFPWNAYGMALGDWPALAQIASVVGVGGLTLLAIAIGAAPATLADPRRPGTFARFRATLAALVLFGAALGFGTLRLQGSVADVPDVRLRIVQPNVAQDDRFSYANKDEILAGYIALSGRATSPTTTGLKDVTHLIWPESPFPFILSRDPDALAAIGGALPDGTVLITGAARLETDPGATPARPGRAHYFNAAEVIGSGGLVLDSYDKVHLVPFGEYLPLDSVLSRLGLTHFVHIPGGFEPGPRHRLLDVPGLPPVAPAICYEAIFTTEILPDGSERERRRAGLILNITNDGWFGRTAGPYQHFAQARLRAVELGLPLIRAANSGISAIVDPFGHVRASLPLGVANVLDGALPERLPPTFYARHQNWIEPCLPIAGLLAALFAALFTRRRASVAALAKSRRSF